MLSLRRGLFVPIALYGSYKAQNYITTPKYTFADDLSEDNVYPEFEVDVPEQHIIKYDFKLKTRKEHLSELKDEENEFDLLIIGGGCNGAGVALDASSRGLKCVVIDSYDFGSGTSSRSSKLAHGGIRFLQ